jgi:hypothetical protein
VPTIIDLLRESPEVGDQLKRLDAAFNRMAEIFRPLREFAAAAIQRVAESDPSLGYEPMLVERRVDRIVARMTAHLLVRKGTRIARESQFSQPVVNAIRFLARSRRQSAILRRAQFLLGVCEKTVDGPNDILQSWPR